MAELRRMAVPIGIVAAVLLILLFNPWLNIEEGILRQVLTVGFWASFLLLLVVLFEDRKDPAASDGRDRGAALHALPVLEHPRPACSGCRSGCSSASPGSRPAGTSSTGGGWIDGGGSALAGFWTNAVNVPEQGRAADHLRVVSRLHQRPADRAITRRGSPG